MSGQVFRAPEPDVLELRVMSMINVLCDRLKHRVAEPRRWIGALRRMAFARAVQASNSIEGYDASLDDVIAAVDGEPTLDADTETQLALAGYRDAMTYVLQVAQDDAASVDAGLVKSLHFMMLKHELSKNPGRWRPGAVFVRRESTGEIVYEGPDADAVAALIATTIAELERDPAPVLFKAAMAHLNLVMIHPFSNGNGRMARALQTLVLAREQIVAPVFSSIEEYLGRNTQDYYDVLAEVGGGSWNPHYDARPWVRFCLTAHYRQATTHLRRVEEAEALYRTCYDLAASHGLPERSTAGLVEAAYGFRLRNATYRAAVENTNGDAIANLTASRDLRALVDAGLLKAIGDTRGRYYVADQGLLEVRQDIRASRPPRETTDPFAVVAGQLELSLD